MKVAEKVAKRIAYCGRVGSFSHEAATKMFPSDDLQKFEYIGFDTFAKAVEEVERGQANYAILPIENSSAGRVAEIHNILPNVNLFFCKEYILKVCHNFYVLNNEVKIENINEIHSHQQALMQCSGFISKTLSSKTNATQVNELNTAIAAEKLSISKKSNVGVVCSQIAGKHYNLHLLAENIQNNNENFTTFIALCKKPNLIEETNLQAENSHKVLTSILFQINNKAGGIYEALGCFARNGVNLLKIESYIPSVSSSYAQFFLTFAGNLTGKSVENENAKKALLEMGAIASHMKIFGSYFADEKRFSI